MSQGSRPSRVADQIRAELASLLAREVHDPGIGFVTLTRVEVTPDLQQARVYYTALGDEKTRTASGRALGRAAPFLRRQIGSRLRLKRVPELTFVFDESVAGQDRIEQLLHEIHEHDESVRGAEEGSATRASEPSDATPRDGTAADPASPGTSEPAGGSASDKHDQS
jgi:ribosome-binding factor A